MTREMIAELYNLYHLAKTALGHRGVNFYDRKQWAAREFHKLYPEISETRAYLAFERTDAGLPA